MNRLIFAILVFFVSPVSLSAQTDVYLETERTGGGKMPR